MRKVLYPSVKSSLSARRAALELSPLPITSAGRRQRSIESNIHLSVYLSVATRMGSSAQNTIGAVADILPPMAAVAVCAMPMVMAALNVCDSSE